ncbi:MAG: hypothetical protein ACM3ZC_16180 [Bacteroidota bacterium]
MRRMVLAFIVGGLIAASVASAAAAQTAADMRRPQVDLAWFMYGLRDLGKSKDNKLKLQPAQAKKILPELEALVEEHILVVDLNARTRGGQEQNQGGQGQTRWRGGANGGGLTEAQRREMAARQQKLADRIETAIDRMEKALNQAQMDYIMNLEFDEAKFGMGFTLVQRGNQSGTNQAQIQKLRQEMQKARERLVQMNKEVIEMVRKLAK